MFVLSRLEAVGLGLLAHLMPFVPQLLASLAAILGGMLLRKLGDWRVGRLPLDGDDRLRWRVAARNLALGIVLTALAVIWAPQIQDILLSVVAITAAVVLALKEFILCLSGATYRSFSKAFSVGDRIEVGGWRGDVIDFGPLATTILEVGPGPSVNQVSGRTVVLPNSIFLQHPVVNETFTDQYVLHPFTITLKRSEDWQRAERLILEAAQEVCGPFLPDARTFLSDKLDRFSIAPISAEPRVHLRLHHADQIEVMVRIPCPVRQKGKVEQAIVRKFLEGMRD